MRSSGHAPDPPAELTALWDALEVSVADPLRAQGFQGELPCLRRIEADRWDLLGVRITSEGVRLAVASHPPGAHIRADGTVVPLEELTVAEIEGLPGSLCVTVDTAPSPSVTPRSPYASPDGVPVRWPAYWVPSPQQSLPGDQLEFRHPSVVAWQVWEILNQQAMDHWENSPLPCCEDSGP